jgi:hypothetical protein
MSRAIFFVSLIVAVVTAAQADSPGNKTKVQSFQQFSQKSSTAAKPEDRHAGVADGEADSETDAESMQNSQEIAHMIAESMRDVVESSFVESDSKSASGATAEATGHAIAEAYVGMSDIASHSKYVRSAVDSLTKSLGLDHHVKNLELRQAAAKEAMVQLALVHQRVHADMNGLNKELEAISSNVDAIQEPVEVDDEKFAAVEQQTKNMLAWFQQIKQLRSDRDKMKAQTEAAMSTAKALGITPEEVTKDLTAKGLKLYGLKNEAE